MSIPEHLQDGIHVARVAEVTQSSHADNGRRPTPWQPPWISAARRCVVSFQINISAIHWQTGLSVILNWTHMCSSSYVCRQWWHYSHLPAACCSAVCYAAINPYLLQTGPTAAKTDRWHPRDGQIVLCIVCRQYQQDRYVGHSHLAKCQSQKIPKHDYGHFHVTTVAWHWYRLRCDFLLVFYSALMSRWNRYRVISRQSHIPMLIWTSISGLWKLH